MKISKTPLFKCSVKNSQIKIKKSRGRDSENINIEFAPLNKK